MPVFENIRSKVASVSSSVSERRERLTQSSRLSSIKKEYLAQLDGIFMRIGKEYCAFDDPLGAGLAARHAHDGNGHAGREPNPEKRAALKAMYREAAAVNGKLLDVNEKLLHLKGFKLCRGCLAEVEKGILYCPSCGNKQLTVDEVEKSIKDAMAILGGDEGPDAKPANGGRAQRPVKAADARADEKILIMDVDGGPRQGGAKGGTAGPEGGRGSQHPGDGIKGITIEDEARG
ncbi:MAG: hypothetical protein FWE70_05730 [Oscillospiraceae bacterium]|nr:hypothetical protein [Oscillospiraceae bacterium]